MKNVNLPRKCYWVYWCLSWCIDEYDIDEITYDCNTEEIIKVKCHRPHNCREFNNEEISNTVFFDLSLAQKALLKFKEG